MIGLHRELSKERPTFSYNKQSPSRVQSTDDQ